ncbi:MAG: tRNA lysidine(34) synthetase TilS [Alphaproteobacteria bacterium]|nr:tRNA lysidine(34) synthetase TilS [Alphaproteobacteria bacterium]
MDRLVEGGAPWPGAIGVSGGADSMALMHLLADWAQARGVSAPVVLSVDHGLRKDSGDDAKRVMKAARAAGLESHVLSWEGAKPKADIEAEARNARYALMGAWCRERGVTGHYVAHTEDDQAETFLLRLARGSGLDGLSAMRTVAAFPLAGYAELCVVRPLLEFRRMDLRAFLKKRGQDWIEDPMNADPRFARSRLRAAWPALEDLGLTVPRIADAAAHLGRARAALEEVTGDLFRRAVRLEDQQAFVDPLRLKMAMREVGLRVLAEVLSRVSGEAYRPRFESLERLFDAIVGGTLGGGATLHGCRVAPAAKAQAYFGSATLVVAPEPARSARS